MGNSNMELDTRLQKLERRLENYQSSIEPKSGEFTGQNWYNTATEVLNVWNGRAFTPAYGNSIVQDLEGFETRIAQNEYELEFEVIQSDNIIAAINLSAEGVNILGDKITLDGDVTVTGAFTLDSINDGSTYKRVTSNEKTGAGRGYNALNSSSRYSKWITNGELSAGSNPTSGIIMDSAGIRGYKSSVKQFEIDVSGNAYFRGEIAADTGYIKTLDIDGTLTMNVSGEIISSNYSTSYGWKIDNSGIYMGIDSELYMRPGSGIYLGYGGAGAKTTILPGNIGFLYSSTATEAVISSDYDGTLFFGKADTNGNLTFSSTADILLNSTNNRIKSGTDGEIYYNGLVWRKRDSTGWSDL